jgi:uracil-DNA glycosylase family 4
MSRGDVYITNVIKERPRDNNPENGFITFTQGRVSETTPAFLEHVENLRKQLEQCKANVFVALGNIALYALCNLEKPKITSRRGSIMESTLLPGRKVIPVIHPGSAQRDYFMRYPILRDLQKARRESLFPSIRLPQRELLIRPSYIEVMEYIERAKGSTVFSFDIELIRQEIDCIAIALAPDLSMSIPFFEGGNRNFFSPEHEVEIWTALAELFALPMHKIGHNTSFDATLLYRTLHILPVNMDDTMVARRITKPDLAMALEAVTADYTDEPYYKDEGKRWKDPTVTDEEFWTYNAKDAAVTYEVSFPLAKELRRQNNASTYKRQISILRPLIYMMVKGIRMDVEGLKRGYTESQEKIKKLQEELDAIAGHHINFDSPAQVRNYFYVEKGLKPYTHKGKVTVDVTAMKRLASKGIQEARIIQEVRSIRTVASTFLDMKLDEDGRLRCSFNPVGAATGRLSSSKRIDTGTGMNQQNQPTLTKMLMLADEGYMLYELDKEQAENRIVAYCAPEPLMIKAFENGIDVHRQTYGLMFNIPIDQVSDVKGSCDLGTGRDSQRDWGKRSNHSLNYDLGPDEFRLRYECSLQEAKLLITRYHSVYPGVKAHYHAWIQNQLSKDRTIINCHPFERRRTFLGPWGRETWKQAYSHFAQSTVGDLINECGLAYMDNNEEFREVELLNQVHDSIIIQIPLSLPWITHAILVWKLIASLDIPLRFRSTEFVIPTGLKAGLRLGVAKKVKHYGVQPKDLAITLEQIYKDAVEYERQSITRLA